MNNQYLLALKKLIARARRSCALAAMLAIICVTAYSQNPSSNPLDGYTPSGLAPGAPVGSYTLNGFDNINPYSGGMNFSLPLLNIGGRGSAAYTMYLPIEQKWTVTHDTADDGQGRHYDFYDPSFNEFITGTRAGYGPGVLYGRQVGSVYQYCDYIGTSVPEKTLTRFTFVTSNGTEYELRDVQTDGRPFDVGSCALNGTSRGKVFRTADGSSATFISDQQVVDAIFIYSGVIGASGYVYLKDGTSYRIDGGQVTWMADRNGNKLTFVYNGLGVTSIKDSLNREITIAYGVNDGAPYGVCDRITYKGFGGTDRVIRVSYDNMSHILRSGFSMQSPHTLFPALNNASNADPGTGGLLVSAVWLPDGRSYKFLYNNYVELARVELPTGGAFEYDWDGGYNNGPSSGAICYACSIYRRVTERRVYADGTNLESRMTFSKPDTFNNGPVESSAYVEVNNYDAASRLMGTERHYYFGHAWQSLQPNDPTAYNAWDEGKEYQTDVLDASGTLSRRLTNTWDKTAPTWQFGPASNPRIIESDTTIEPDSANLTSRQTFSYDQYNNTTESYEYDYNGALIRRSHTDYLTTNSVNGAAYDTVNPSNSSPDPSATVHLRNLPALQSIYDGAGVERARTTFEYDNYTGDGGFHAGLVSRSSITSLSDGTCQSCPSAPNFTDASYTKRGNVTSVKRYLLDGSGSPPSITAYSQYDVAGNVVKIIDPRSTSTNIIATTFSFTDCFGAPDTDAQTNSGASELGSGYSYAFPTAVTNALNQSVHLQYDFHLGRAVNVEDANGIVSASFYDDLLDRPTKGIRAINAGTDVKSQTLIEYDDANHVITSKNDKTTFNDTSPLKSATVYDGLGRTVQSRQYETSTQYIAVDQVPFVRLQDPDTTAWTTATQSSNPYRPYLSETPVWNTSFSDSLGRMIKVRTPDNAIVKTVYSGNTATVTDQALKARKSESDAAGRLTKVYEDPAGLNYVTNYTYDALNELTGVSQYDPDSNYTQTRTFVYDSLKRLLSATNPESGVICYGTISSGQCQANGYDSNGNLLYKTDARGVLTTFATYDALNRPTSKSYSDGTPPVNYFYDSQTLPSGAPSASAPDSYSRGYSTGRLVAVTYGGGSQGDYYGFDAVGRSVLKIQQTGGVNYRMSAAYNLAGAMTGETYPSTHTVSYAYDLAGRMNSFTGYLGDGNSRNYSTEITYSPFGMAKEKFGTATPIYSKMLYNVRGQLGETRAGTTYTDATDTSWNRGAIVNSYSNQPGCWGASCSATDNNGNLQRQDVFIPLVDIPQPIGTGQNTSVSQQFDYDSLNRLQDVHEGSAWTQTFHYDRWGNRTIVAGSTTDGIPKPSYGIDYTSNRLTPPSGKTMIYDPAGNLSYDNTNGSQGDRVFDAESRMTSARGGLNGASQYSVYDGAGKRVKRNVTSGQICQVYGIFGELLAEYTSNGTQLTKEYGYRSGRLLITAAVASTGWGAPPVIHDNPLVTHETTVQSRHITELRDGINALRSHLGMSPHTWTTSANVDDWITADPILEMRVALDEALGPPSPSYTAGLAQNQPILAAHIQELRNRVLGAWDSGTEGVDIRWLIEDQLGTPRIVLDQNGSFSGTTRHDYLPFGEELTAGSRTFDHGYTNYDANRQRFTGYERDEETDLDYARARYFSHGQGRFTSADPGMAGSDLNDPQSWDAYTYGLNNPLKLTDPSGRYNEGGGTAEDDPQNPEKERAIDAKLVTKRDRTYNPNAPLFKDPITVTSGEAEPISTGGNPNIVTSLPLRKIQFEEPAEEAPEHGSETEDEEFARERMEAGHPVDINDTRDIEEEFERTVLGQDELELARVNRAIDDLISRTGVVSQSRTLLQMTTSGGMNQAIRDFHILRGELDFNAFNSATGGQGMFFRLPNGAGSVSVRELSSYGAPTIQINRIGQADVKIRYEH